MTKKIWEEFSLRNIKYSKLLKLNTGLKKKDFAPLIYPSLDEISKLGLRGIYLGNYVMWDAKKQTEDMIQEYGYETTEQQRTHNTYESIYCRNNAGVHDYIKYLKYGYGKVTDHVNRDIRFKRINRNDVIKIVSKYEKIIPKDLDVFLKWARITKKKFYSYFKKNKIQSDYNTQKFSTEEINEVEKKLNYKKTKNLEKENLEDDYIIFGRTYMDEKNYKSLEG